MNTEVQNLKSLAAKARLERTELPAWAGPLMDYQASTYEQQAQHLQSLSPCRGCDRPTTGKYCERCDEEVHALAVSEDSDGLPVWAAWLLLVAMVIGSYAGLLLGAGIQWPWR